MSGGLLEGRTDMAVPEVEVSNLSVLTMSLNR